MHRDPIGELTDAFHYERQILRASPGAVPNVAVQRLTAEHESLAFAIPAASPPKATPQAPSRSSFGHVSDVAPREE